MNDAAVDIVCPVFNGAPYLEAFLNSLQAQTHANWQLWIRDDGSTDDSAAIAAAYAKRDPRVRLLAGGGAQLGVVSAFNWLLQRVPPGAGYIMFADQDDVWLPDKIALSLVTMHAAEAQAPGPILVHTDLTVAGADLNAIDQSFWHFAGINPEPRSLQQVIVRNVVTGATALMNRALRERVGDIPSAAVVHDWWVACVATAFGRVVPVRTQTVLYRQHGANSIGARRPSSALPWHDVIREAPTALRRATRVRAGLTAAARQAGAFLDHYHDALSAAERRFLAAYARIPERRFVRRKIDLVRMQLLAESGVVQNIGILIRG